MDIIPEPTSQSLYIPTGQNNYQNQNIGSPNNINDILAQSAQENSAYNYGNITSFQNTEEYPATDYANVGNTQTNEAYAFENVQENMNTNMNTYNAMTETYSPVEDTNININYIQGNENTPLEYEENNVNINMNMNENTYTTNTEGYPPTNYAIDNNVVSQTEAYPATNYEVNNVNNDYQEQEAYQENDNAYNENASPYIEAPLQTYNTDSYNMPNYSTMSTPVPTPQYKKYFSHIPLTNSKVKVVTKYVTVPPSQLVPESNTLRSSGFFSFPPDEGQVNPR